MTAPDDCADPLWAATSYFNPQAYARRLRNYHTFRERLCVPLVTVEWSCDGRFQLGEDDADILIQLQAPDLLWQKERLLNVAIAAIPEKCRKVAWLDCDVVFETHDWPEQATRLLDSFAMVQLFDRFYDLSRKAPEGVLNSAHAMNIGDAFVAVRERAGADRELFGTLWGSRVVQEAEGTRVERVRNSGFAWAARREILERHGLYDGCILGCGDRAIVCAAYGKHNTAKQSWITTEQQRAHYLKWAEEFFSTVRGEVSYIQGGVFHLWHGELRDRRYRERNRDLARFGFDPFTDLALSETGCWRWNSEKPAMHEYLRDYFALRNEDGD